MSTVRKVKTKTNKHAPRTGTRSTLSHVGRVVYFAPPAPPRFRKPTNHARTRNHRLKQQPPTRISNDRWNHARATRGALGAAFCGTQKVLATRQKPQNCATTRDIVNGTADRLSFASQEALGGGRYQRHASSSLAKKLHTASSLGFSYTCHKEYTCQNKHTAHTHAHHRQHHHTHSGAAAAALLLLLLMPTVVLTIHTRHALAYT